MLTLNAALRVLHLHRAYGDSGRHQFGGPETPPTARRDSSGKPNRGSFVWTWVPELEKFGYIGKPPTEG